MKKNMTMQDIANTSGVAKSTVSRYFNGGYVKEETREKIRKVIAETNYQPNTFAQSLKAKQSKIIGIIAPCLDSTVSSRIMMAIDEYLRREGYTSLIINTNHEERLELENIEKLWRMKVDGILLIATHISEEHKRIIKKIEIPLVAIGQRYEQGVSIINADYEAGLLAGRYAKEMGHSNIIYLGVDESDEAVGIKRKQGVLDGCGNAQVIESDFSFEQAYHKISDVLHQRFVDMIICATDMMAMGALKALQEQHIAIPQEVSLMGFGGYEVSSLITPRLTTIRFDNAAAGTLGAQTLLKMMREEPVESQQMIQFTFLEGESVSKKNLK